MPRYTKNHIRNKKWPSTQTKYHKQKRTNLPRNNYQEDLPKPPRIRRHVGETPKIPNIEINERKANWKQKGKRKSFSSKLFNFGQKLHNSINLAKILQKDAKSVFQMGQ
nr:hypothetical protein [Cressdnaviricota sp.]